MRVPDLSTSIHQETASTRTSTKNKRYRGEDFSCRRPAAHNHRPAYSGVEATAAGGSQAAERFNLERPGHQTPEHGSGGAAGGSCCLPM